MGFSTKLRYYVHSAFGQQIQSRYGYFTPCIAEIIETNIIQHYQHYQPYQQYQQYQQYIRSFLNILQRYSAHLATVLNTINIVNM